MRNWGVPIVVVACLGSAAPAHAGWTAPRKLPPGATGTSVAIGPRGTGALLARFPGPVSVLSRALFDAGAVPGPFAPVPLAPGSTESGSYLPEPAGGSVTAVSGQDGSVLANLVDPAGVLSAPLVAPPGGAPGGLTATNARGDKVLLSGSGTDARPLSILIQRAGEAPQAPVAVADPGVVSALDVAIGDNGDVAAAWLRGPQVEGRLRDGAGALTPVVVLTPPGLAREAAVAVDGAGRADLLAIGQSQTSPPLSTLVSARREPGGAFGPQAALDTGEQLDSLEADAAGRHLVATWVRGGTATVNRIHAAGRRDGAALARIPVAAPRGGSGAVTAPALAVARDGGAVIGQSFGGAVLASRRAPGARAFPRPRVLSTLQGAFLSADGPGRSVDAASGGRGIVAFTAGGREVVSAFGPRFRDESGREDRTPPRFRATPPIVDLRTRPGVLRYTVRCDGPCRTNLRLIVRGTDTLIIRNQRVLPRGGRAEIAEPLTATEDRVLRATPRRPQRITGSISAANRYGTTAQRLVREVARLTG